MNDAIALLLDEPIANSRGRKAKPLSMAYLRDLSASDLAILADTPNKGVTTPPVQRLRHSHHLIARLKAEGRRDVEIAAWTGYSQSRLSILNNDPAFQELIAYYKLNAEACYVGVHEKLAEVGQLALEEVRDRLLDEDRVDKMPTELLMKIMGDAFERSVAPAKGPARGSNGPTAIAVNVQFVEPQASSRVIEGTTDDVSALPEAPIPE